jgi:hypothetical protein
LVALIGLVALFLLPTMVSMRESRIESRAIEKLREAGVTVWLNDFGQSSSAAYRPNGVWRQPESRSLNWYDRFSIFNQSVRRADMVSIVEFEGEVAELEPLTKLRYVESLSYVNASVESDLVDILLRLPSLRHLNLSDTDVGDEDLEQLQTKNSLTYINIMGSKVTPEGVREFQALRPDCKLSVRVDIGFMTWLKQLQDRQASESAGLPGK